MERVDHREGESVFEVFGFLYWANSLRYVAKCLSTAGCHATLAINWANGAPVMELAVILAAGLRDWIDLGVIIGILMLNAIVGWYQEKQAADVVASLKGDIAMRSTVVRNGQEEEIKARELVPGDIVSFATRSIESPDRN